MEEAAHVRYHKKLFYIFALIVMLLTIGAFFYHIVEKWRYLDALYFAAATMTTVGYGDIAPKTDLGRFFTVFYLFASVGIGLYGISTLASHFVEEREAEWMIRVTKDKMKVESHTNELKKKIKKFFIMDKDKAIEGHEELFRKD